MSWSANNAPFKNLVGRLCMGLTCSLMLVLCQARITAQVSTADVVGTVTDSTGAVVPNAVAKLQDLSTSLKYSAQSNGQGDIAIPQLPAGHYSVTVNAAGFSEWQLADVTLVAGQRFRVEPKLVVGATGQVVRVTAEPAPLQTDSSTVSSTVNDEQTQNLPLNGRNVIELAQYSAGATDYKGGGFSGTPDDERRDSTIAVSGRTGAENNFLIDGQDNNERFVNTILVKPSEDGIAELRVVSNSPSAELGRAAGATIVFVTKGGANQIHGTAYEFFRNQALDAFPQNTAPGTPKPPYKQNNYGGSIGGPISKDRLFYFGDFETYTASTGTVRVSTVPTATMRTGNFDGIADIFDPNTTQTVNGVSTRQQFPGNTIPQSEINPVSQSLINLYPLPNIPGAGLSNNFSYTSNLAQTDRTVDTRLDLKISNTNSIFVRYNWDQADTTQPTYLPPADGFQLGGCPDGTIPYCYGQSGVAHQVINSSGVVDTITLSSAAVLILRAGYGRYQNQALPLGFGTTPATQLGMQGVNIDQFSSGFPDIASSGFTGLGAGNFYPTLNTNNAFSYGASLQLLKGKHLMKMGGEFVRRQVSDYQSQEPKIAYQFTTSFTADPENFTSTGNGMASLLLGYPASTVRVRYLIFPGYRTLENGWYAQDDYRISHNLTLNLGVRYDYFSPLSEVQNRISNFDYSAAKVMVAGQNGIGNTAGVGKDFSDIGPRVGFSWQVGKQTSIFGAFGISYTPGMLGTPGAMRNAPFISNLNITPDLITPANKISDPVAALVPDSISNPIGIFFAVDRHYKLPYNEQINLSVQHELPFSTVLTVAYVSSLGRRQSGSNNALPLNGTSPGAAAVQTRRPLSSLFPSMAEVDTVKNYFTSSYESLQTTLQKRLSNNMTFNINYTWSHAIDNEEVRYYVPQVYSTIGGSSPSDIRNRFAAMWVYDLPSNWAKSEWLSPVVRNWRFNVIAQAEDGVPFDVLQVYSQTNGADGTNRPNRVADFHVKNASAQQWFNPAAFAPQGNYTWGNAGRNLIHSPGTWNMDLGLHRDVRLYERLTAQFRAEAFDFTNTRHPNQPINYLGQPGFGSITTYNSNRTMQVAVKLLF